MVQRCRESVVFVEIRVWIFVIFIISARSQICLGWFFCYWQTSYSRVWLLDDLMKDLISGLKMLSELKKKKYVKKPKQNITPIVNWNWSPFVTQLLIQFDAHCFCLWCLCFLGTVTFCTCLWGYHEKKAWRHCIEALHPPFWVLCPMLVSASSPMRHSRKYMQVLHYHCPI